MDRRLDYDADRAAHAAEIRKRMAVGASFRPPKTHSSRRTRSLEESLLLIAAARRAWREAVARGEIREVEANRVVIRW